MSADAFQVAAEDRRERWRREDDRRLHRLSLSVAGVLACVIIWAVLTLWMVDRLSTELARIWDEQSRQNQIMQDGLRDLRELLRQ